MENQQPGRGVEKNVKTSLLSKVRTIWSISLLILSLLFFQYLLGMIANLYLNFPTETASVNPLDSVFTSGPYLVLIHTVNGLALGLLSTCVLILSVLVKNKRFIVISLFGIGSILFAGESGIEFVLGWYSNNLFSFLMSLGFMFSFTAYFVLLWYASKTTLEMNE